MVSPHPPWSTATSTNTAPGFISFRYFFLKIFGAAFPGIRTEPITRSASFTAFSIFKESIFTLSDGFHEKDLNNYSEDISKIPGVIDVPSIKGRYHGNSVFLDVTIVVDKKLSLDEAHDICDLVEKELQKSGVYSSYVHPEPNL